MCLQQTASHVTATITVERKVIWTNYSWEIIKNNTYFILAIITYEGVFLREFLPCMVLNYIIYRSKYTMGLFKWNCFGDSSGQRSGAHKKSPKALKQACHWQTHQPQPVSLLHKNSLSAEGSTAVLGPWYLYLTSTALQYLRGPLHHHPATVKLF
jgi:hypothetical protein